jgi:serine protease AprX
VKVGEMSRVTHENLQRGLDWVVRNRKRYDIRIVNVSCGGDYQASYLRDALSQAAERATRAGILVCAAVGNQGQLARPSRAAARLRPLRAHRGRRGRPQPAGLRRVRHVPLELRAHRGRPAEARGDRARHLGGAPILPGTPTAAQAQLLPRWPRRKTASSRR